MVMNAMKEYHTHEVWFSYKADEDGEICDFEGSIYASLDDDMIKICDDEIKEMRFGHSSSQFEWDGYVSGLVDVTKELKNLDSYYDDREMEDITYGGHIKIDKRSREYKRLKDYLSSWKKRVISLSSSL